MTEEELAKHDSKTLLQLLLSADARCDALTAQLAEDADARNVVDARLEQLFNTLLIDGAKLQIRAEAAEADAARLRAALEDIADHDTGATAGLAYTAKIALKGETP